MFVDFKRSIAQNLVQHLFVTILHKYDLVTTSKFSMTKHGTLILMMVLFGQVDPIALDLILKLPLAVSNSSSLCQCISHVQHRHLPVYVRR